MKWLTECSPAAVAGALRSVAPDLSAQRIVVRESVGGDPQWWAASATVGDEFIAKFAWSHPAALRVAHEIQMLAALAGDPRISHLPEVVASSTDPVLLVTRRVPGTALFDIVDAIDRDHAGHQLAQFLAGLHHPATLERVEHHLGGLAPVLLPPATTNAIRDRIARWIRPDQIESVLRWCDWADDVLASPSETVLAHGDLHGGNQIWDADELRVVLDFETAGTADPEYDLRALPATGPGINLLQSTLHHYNHLTTRTLSLDRVIAWHLRTMLDDALWRSEAGVPLPDLRTPPAWIDDLSTRLATLGIDTNPTP